MSEQTPGTNDGISNAQEPSMEDILASIRKIIAEDDVQPSAGLDSQVESVGADALAGDVSELAQADHLDLDVVAEDITETNPESDTMDIDALLGDVDAHGGLEEQAVMAPEAFSASDAQEDNVLDLMIPMGEENTDVAVDDFMDLALNDELELLTPDIEATDVAVAPELHEEPVAVLAAMAGAGAASLNPVDDDLSLMLDNMLEESLSEQDFEGPATEDLLAEELVLEDVVSEAPVIDEEVADIGDDLFDEIGLILDDDADVDLELGQEEVSQTDPDIDLVKSLMAELTEEPLHDNLVEDVSAIDIDDADDSSDVMDEILSMTLDDETQLSEAAEIADLDTAFIEEALVEGPTTEILSLKDIAAAAEAEADASDGGLPKGILAGLGAAAIGGAAVAATQEDEAELEALELEVSELEAPEADDVDAMLSELDDLLDDDTVIAEDQLPEEPVHITPEPITEETTPMARAKKSDAIIDEVTEEATSGAFASLTSVVETKAVRAERGDRIGDLVTEALQPMLKEWLDKNLKGIVERAVTKEVKRISSGK